ncbi:OmpA family protein [Pelomonas cellulosilytica]|uniref:OmpA family protein n=1 Tax=Pelomonas cellulosilytica TaxID=2906762 RepID=A0ABS8Y093_9BURK|nr:OmpA family protein [Pelomonas sp. P8]MCE4558251.1 OmpA family protein [Pelomonas sp. P8]
MNIRLHTTPLRTALTATGVALLAACSSIPIQNSMLDQARSRLQAAQAEPQTVAMAADELARAREMLRRGDQALANGNDTAQVTHLGYMALQQVVIAEETAASRKAQAVVAGAGAERDRMRLELRTREADTAQAQKATAEQASAMKSAELAQSRANTQTERDRVARRDAKVSDLESQLHDMNARQTDRGTVVTLGDLLFNTGAARLRPAGERSMAKLADFMRRNPEQRASIEGYTDSTGSTATNQALSDRRAHAVMSALMQQGVPGNQLTTQGFGEERPVASNDTAGGRQMNRRVEVVFASLTEGPARN